MKSIRKHNFLIIANRFLMILMGTDAKQMTCKLTWFKTIKFAKMEFPKCLLDFENFKWAGTISSRNRIRVMVIVCVLQKSWNVQTQRNYSFDCMVFRLRESIISENLSLSGSKAVNLSCLNSISTHLMLPHE